MELLCARQTFTAHSAVEFHRVCGRALMVSGTMTSHGGCRLVCGTFFTYCKTSCFILQVLCRCCVFLTQIFVPLMVMQGISYLLLGSGGCSPSQQSLKGWDLPGTFCGSPVDEPCCRQSFFWLIPSQFGVSKHQLPQGSNLWPYCCKALAIATPSTMWPLLKYLILYRCLRTNVVSVLQ